MGKKKRKMTPAQAAAARRDDRPKQTHSTQIKDNGPRDRGNTFIMGITIAMIALIVVLSLVFTIGPFNSGA